VQPAFHSHQLHRFLTNTIIRQRRCQT